MTTLFGRIPGAALGLTLFLSALAGSVYADLIAYDGFDHAAGSVVGQTGPTGFGAPYTAVGAGYNVSTPGSTYPGLPVSGKKLLLTGTNNGVEGILANPSSTPGSTVYFSFLMQASTSGANSAGLAFYQGETETLSVGSRTNLLTVDPKGGTAGNAASSTSALTMVVGRIDFSASGATIRLYVNPTSTIEPVNARVTVTKTSALTYDRIRIVSSGVTGTFDEFRLGTTYADVAPIPFGSAAEKIVVLGSSVAAGQGASQQSLAWAYRFKNLMETQTPIVPGSAVKWQVGNASIGGDTTTKVLNRFQTDLVNAYPDADIVIIGLSLANEGLVGANDATAEAVYNGFKGGLAEIVARCRARGYYPVISLVYPNDNYTTSQYGFVRRMNLLLNTWDVPTINFLGGTDNGAGHWATGYVTDAYHPNDAGHGELFYSVVPSLFEAIAAGKTTPPRLQGTNSALRLARDENEPAPIRFVPAQTTRSFTMSFRVRTTEVGTIAAVGAGASRATLEVRENALVYVGPSGATITAPLAANNGHWYDVALSHRYATSQSFLFVDGVLKGTVTDQYVPDRFVLGGAAGASGRPPAPLQADYQDFCVYRAAWTADEARAQSNGALQQASLEICAPLADTAPANGAPLENRAQSLASVTLHTANFTSLTAMPPDQLAAESFAAGTASLTWAGHGAGSFTVERRRTGTADSWTTVATTTQPSFEDGGLTASQSYDYRVSVPEGALQGDYSNVVSVVAGGQDALTYLQWISRHYVDDTATYLVDFNTAASPNYNGVRWNTVNSQTSTTPYALVDTAGRSVGITLTLTESFDQFRNDGVAPLVDYATAAQTSMFALRDKVPLSGTMIFGGLVPLANYDFSFFARRGALVAGYDYTGTYTFTGGGSPVAVVVDAATNAVLTNVPGVTASASGTVTLKITAGPGTGNDFPVINFLRFSPAGGSQAYQQKIGATADPDGDGMTNFEEYARGLDPTRPDARPFVPDAFGVNSVGSGADLTFKKNRRARDVIYTLERSIDLKTWQTDSQATMTVVSRVGALETVAYSSPADQTALFFRVQIK